MPPVTGPRHLRWTYLTAVLLLSGTLGWLGWKIVRQDAQLAAVRLSERAENAADLAVVTLERRLGAVEEDLGHILEGASPTDGPPEGAVLVLFTPDSFQAWPCDHLAFVPDVPGGITAVPALPGVDAAQFGRRDYTTAIGLLLPITTSADEQLRAAALARLGQSYLAAGRHAEALGAYDSLSQLGLVTIAGIPAALAGRLGALHVHEQRHDRAAIQHAKDSLRGAFDAARCRLSASAHGFFVEELIRQGFSAPTSSSTAFAEAAARVWEELRGGKRGATGRLTLEIVRRPIVMVWRSNDSQMAAFAADANFITENWLMPAGLRVSLSTPDGVRVTGIAARAGERQAVRMSSVTGLPWTVVALPQTDQRELTALHSRRVLFGAGISVLLLLVVVCTWVVARAVSRELAVARLQSEFVSAVSHEFRTPLTTLCQLTELLERGRVANEQDRQSYYHYLRRESDRLRRLVEGLLNLGRLQTGRMDFRFEPLDPASLAEMCLEDFRRAHTGADHPVVFSRVNEVPSVAADAEALRCALWNLLDNAFKYSPDGSPIDLTVRGQAGSAEIAVRDSGIGIEPSERPHIFDRFVRGSAARHPSVGGTGIGLATAREIVRAHGGDLTVESHVGIGSTFTIRLPDARRRASWATRLANGPFRALSWNAHARSLK